MTDDAGSPALSPPVTVSVVVAARNTGDRVLDCLASLAPQCGPRGAECVVVATGTAPSRAVVDRFAPVVRLVTRPGPCLVPELWAHGIRAVRGDIVALTTADCVPDAGWLARVAAGPWDSVAAIGGALELRPAAPPDSVGLFYQRYSAYLPSRPAGPATDLAADNAAYKRSALLDCADLWAHGFWEPAVHHHLLDRGERLRFDPAMLVHFQHRGPVGDMLRQRYLHGKSFAEGRTTGSSETVRWLRAVSAPLLPAVLAARIGRRLVSRHRWSLRLLRALPWLLLYLAAWSAGECRGYLRGASSA